MSPTTLVLVRRAHEPLAGRWSLPGGAIELGETLHAAIVREVFEETGLAVEAGPLVEVVDHLDIDAAGRAAWHFVIVDYLCRPVAGEPIAGGDADRVAVVDLTELDAYDLTARTLAVIDRAFELYTERGRYP
jgi:mutator protein MutT